MCRDHLLCLLQDCLELLCACPVVDLSVKDQWNRIAADVATVECKEILTNRGTICMGHYFIIM